LNLLLQAWPKNPAKPLFIKFGLPGGLLAAKKAVQGALPKPPLGNTNESSALWIQHFRCCVFVTARSEFGQSECQVYSNAPEGFEEMS
jgi:hypothetical protein